jgi:hypothetical protein
VIEEYLADLSTQLARLGVRGARRRRILAETEDHLRSDAGATARFGEPAEIAQAFANDIGTRGALRAPLWAFAALAAAGVFYTAMLVAWSGFGAANFGGSAQSASGAFQMVASGRVSGLAVLAAAVMVLAPQVAFAAGVLALLRALRFRGRRSVPAAEVRTLRRRTATAVGFGVISMGAVALFALQLGDRIPSWSAGVLGWGVVGAAASGVLLVASAAAGLRSSTVRVAVAGTAGDIFDDVGPAVPAPLRGHPWAFAATVSGAAALLVWVAGIAASDPYDGAVRGIAEGAACFIGFAILGRFLALRSSR